MEYATPVANCVIYQLCINICSSHSDHTIIGRYNFLFCDSVSKNKISTLGFNALPLINNLNPILWQTDFFWRRIKWILNINLSTFTKRNKFPFWWKSPKIWHTPFETLVFEWIWEVVGTAGMLHTDNHSALFSFFFHLLVRNFNCDMDKWPVWLQKMWNAIHSCPFK